MVVWCSVFGLHIVSGAHWSDGAAGVVEVRGGLWFRWLPGETWLRSGWLIKVVGKGLGGAGSLIGFSAVWHSPEEVPAPFRILLKSEKQVARIKLAWGMWCVYFFCFGLMLQTERNTEPQHKRTIFSADMLWLSKS